VLLVDQAAARGQVEVVRHEGVAGAVEGAGRVDGVGVPGGLAQGEDHAAAGVAGDGRQAARRVGHRLVGDRLDEDVSLSEHASKLARATDGIRDPASGEEAGRRRQSAGRAPRWPTALAASRQPEVRASAGGLPSSHAGRKPAMKASPAPVPSTIFSTGSGGTVTGS